MAGYQLPFNQSETLISQVHTVPTSSHRIAGDLAPQIAGGLAGIFHRADILADLGAIEQRLLECTHSRVAVISAAGAHTVRSGGKRLRAALAILAARLGQYQLERVIHPAAAAELIHAASLVHDDLVDRANRRRGQITVHARWDNDVALMVGDYFFALAAAEMARSLIHASLLSTPKLCKPFAKGNSVRSQLQSHSTAHCASISTKPAPKPQHCLRLPARPGW
jgi:Geranylgeranyl pyrophosphate synthase